MDNIGKKRNGEGKDILYKVFLSGMIIFPLVLAIISLLFFNGVSYGPPYKQSVHHLLIVVLAFGLFFVLYFYKIKKYSGISILKISIAAVIPTALLLSAWYIVTWQEHLNNSVQVVYLFSLLGTALLVLFLLKRGNIKQAVGTCILVGFLLRIAAILIFNTQPVSDFKRVYDYAAMNPLVPSSEIYQAFAYNSVTSPYYGFESITLRGLMNIFGHSVICGQLINVAMSCIMIYMLFKSGMILFEKKEQAIIPAFLFAFYPSAILQDMYFAHESYCSFFIVFFLYYFIKSVIEKRNRKRWLLNLIITGVFLGLLNLYKPILSVYIMAIVVVEAVFFLCHSDKRKLHLYKSAVLVIGLFVTAVAITKIGTFAMESYTQKKVYTTASKSMLHGLNTTVGSGQWSLEMDKMSGELWEKSKGDIKVFDKSVLSYLINDWKSNTRKVPPLLINKFSICWGNEGGVYYGWASQGTPEKTKAWLNTYQGTISAVGDVYAIFLYLFCIAAILKAWKKKDRVILFLAAVISLTAVMLMIVEAQPRYRSMLFVPLCLLAGIGINYAKAVIDNMQILPKTRR